MSTPVSEILDRERVRHGQPRPDARAARRQLIAELVSGGSGAALAVFMWGHMFFVASILLGTRGFDWIALGMESVYIAQPTVVVIFLLFLVHAALAARKIPAQLRERRRFRTLARSLHRARGRYTPDAAGTLPPHVDSWLWIWQVRTGLVILVLGSFHLILMGLDIFTPLFGERIGIEAATSMDRTSAGLVWMYAVLLLCVEFHAGVGLYRLAVKWGVGARLPRRALRRAEQLLFWSFVGLGALVLLVLARVIPPPLAFLLGGG